MIITCTACCMFCDSPSGSIITCTAPLCKAHSQSCTAHERIGGRVVTSVRVDVEGSACLVRVARSSNRAKRCVAHVVNSSVRVARAVLVLKLGASCGRVARASAVRESAVVFRCNALRRLELGGVAACHRRDVEIPCHRRGVDTAVEAHEGGLRKRKCIAAWVNAARKPGDVLRAHS